jgi:hypothetical protein
MFRATLCSSSGQSIISVQHLVYVTLCRWPSGMQFGKEYKKKSRSPIRDFTGQRLRRGTGNPDWGYFILREPARKCYSVSIFGPFINRKKPFISNCTDFTAIALLLHPVVPQFNIHPILRPASLFLVYGAVPCSVLSIGLRVGTFATSRSSLKLLVAKSLRQPCKRMIIARRRIPLI